MIEGVEVKKLKLIPDERGRLMEMMRADDPFFEKFGQCYMTTVYPGVVKAWHYHKTQIDHHVCIKGMVKLVLYDNREDSPTNGELEEFFMGVHNHILIRIPSRVYHGIKCISDDEAIVINIPNEVYRYDDPDEFRVHPHDNDIPYDWSRKDG